MNVVKTNSPSSDAGDEIGDAADCADLCLSGSLLVYIQLSHAYMLVSYTR
jgi:hypothetical protein